MVQGVLSTPFMLSNARDIRLPLIMLWVVSGLVWELRGLFVFWVESGAV